VFVALSNEVLLTRLLLGMGLKQFSMHPAHLLRVKQRVLQSEYATAKAIVDRIRRADESRKVVALLDKLNT
jgi:phosphoenolpyruvate-protein phosphotransferase (PTS system enzyme I)